MVDQNGLLEDAIEPGFNSSLISSFKQYLTTVDIARIRMCRVPIALQPLVKKYHEALSGQLSDPENQSWDSLGLNEHHNALQAVIGQFGTKHKQPLGNCPRCSGLGMILAYSHIRGGRCLQCDGTRNVNK
tara:strand:- start:27 stop:416 length:390 start_codon:yes stop_codon:yes gene_type:complete